MAEKTIKWAESLVAKTFELNEVHHVTAKLADWLAIDTNDLNEKELVLLEQ
jgi:membrane-bound ClpP family serine protease